MNFIEAQLTLPGQEDSGPGWTVRDMSTAVTDRETDRDIGRGGGRPTQGTQEHSNIGT